METVNIQRKTFESMMAEFESLDRKINVLYRKNLASTTDWMDNQDVCLLLDISPRTLQTYRDRKLFPYAQINRKIYYKRTDIEQVIKANIIRENNNLKLK